MEDCRFYIPVSVIRCVRRKISWTNIFWNFGGNFLINAAKGQKQMEDMSKWMQQGFEGFDELTGMFKKFYGLEHMEKDTPAYMETWKEASENSKSPLKIICV